MHPQEDLSDIEKDLEQAMVSFMQYDYKSTTNTSAKIAARDFTRRFERWAREYAYIEARRLTGKL